MQSKILDRVENDPQFFNDFTVSLKRIGTEKTQAKYALTDDEMKTLKEFLAHCRRQKNLPLNSEKRPRSVKHN